MAGVHFVNSAAVHSGCWFGCLRGLRRRWTCNTLGIEILSYFDLCSSVPTSSSIRYPMQRDAASLRLRKQWRRIIVPGLSPKSGQRAGNRAASCWYRCPGRRLRHGPALRRNEGRDPHFGIWYCDAWVRALASICARAADGCSLLLHCRMGNKEYLQPVWGSPTPCIRRVHSGKLDLAITCRC